MRSQAQKPSMCPRRPNDVRTYARAVARRSKVRSVALLPPALVAIIPYTLTLIK